jgi:aquaporin Z
MDARKHLVELIGTFFLVFAIGMSGGTPFGPFAIGFMLTAMIYAGGHISGAHYNPAVTLSVTMRGKGSTVDVAPYMIAQLIGAVLGALISLMFIDRPDKPLDVHIGKALVAEFLWTFSLCFVVLNVATSKSTSGNSFYGIAIGLTVLAGAFAVGGVSGGVFNPAVAVAAIILGGLSFVDIWIYLVANFAAGALAAITFKCLNPDDK